MFRSSLASDQNEDFYDRVMREREAESQRINDKLHVVNGIYEDLGRIVHDQQELVDEVEEQLRRSTACTQDGLAQLERHHHHRRQHSETDWELPSSWTVPFETLGEDFQDVGKDVVDLFQYGAKRLGKIKPRVFQCGSTDEDVIISSTSTTDVSSTQYQPHQQNANSRVKYMGRC